MLLATVPLTRPNGLRGPPLETVGLRGETRSRTAAPPRLRGRRTAIVPSRLDHP